MSSIWVDLLGAEVTFRGRDFRTRVIEAGSGDPLVLLHGIGGHAEAYSRNVLRLGQGVRAMAIDLAWHAQSSKPPVTPAMVPTYGAQVIDLLDSMGLASAHVEGESLGGWVAMWLALNHPKRIKSIILNTTAGVVWPAGEVDTHPQEGTDQLRERSLAAIKNPTPETIRKRLEWLMASPDRVTDELVELRCRYYSEPETKAALTQVFQESFGGDRRRDRLTPADLARIEVPTLVLWSDKNPGEKPDAGQKIADAIPGSRFAVMEDAAHWPQWEHPEVHDRIILEFVR